jgi:hypothetical protein
MSTKYDKPFLGNNQYKVMAEYAWAPIFRTNPRAEENLHMFFSPNRVPVGLTESEVAICVRLYPYRQRMIRRYDAEKDAKIARLNLPPLPPPTFGDALELMASGRYETIDDAMEHLEHWVGMGQRLRLHPIRILSLPGELCSTAPMTRGQFRKGIRLFIAQYRRICGV